MIDKPYWFILPNFGKIGRRDSCSAVSYFLETRIAYATTRSILPIILPE